MPPAAANPPPFARLDGDRVTLVIGLGAGVPVALYWGLRLDDGVDLARLPALLARAETPASPADPPPLALTPMLGQGGPGAPGLAAHRDGLGWAALARVEGVAASPGRVVITSRDPGHGITLVHDLAIAGDVLVATTTLTNSGATPLTVDALAAPVLPLPSHATRLITFEGRWAAEFQTRALDRFPGTYLRENRRGRTSHDNFPALIATAADTGEAHGLAWGWHLGWSGNHRLAVETLADGRASVAMGELLLPGEVRLPPGASLASPPLYASVSDAGLTGLSQAFHRYLRARPQHARLTSRPRPVHYNSWEAVYFDHDPAVLVDLATRAAAVGAERFVLDDGWFLGRRSDRAGLGDWTVDPAIYPHGLAPLIDHVRGLGMEFGLWVEPEMVNPDSDLYRAHPDWVLATPPAPQHDFRHQLVLDFGRAEVREHLFAAIDALLRDHQIAYLKWDMNRDLSHPGGSDGRAGARAHVLGVYAVLDRLRAAHPEVEIESCASGGGRADYAILERTDRIWTSDSNDALDRLAIQRGFSQFFPAELMGSHVGPRHCHITGRTLPMALRVATALFGHMGMEMDLREMDAHETEALAAGVALHKRHRALIHSGDLVRIDAGADANAFAIVAPDRGAALVSYTQLTQPVAVFPPCLRVSGLDPAQDYAVSLEWPIKQNATEIPSLGVFSGELLGRIGLQMPRLRPARPLILQLKAVNPA